METILVTGGAGYIGSQLCKQLAALGHRPITFDDFSSGHRRLVQWGPVVEGSLLDTTSLRRAFTEHRIDAVMHLAARSSVQESIEDPARYFQTNVTGTSNLIDAMRNADVDRMVFSSTATVYGPPRTLPIAEEHPTNPETPYGRSKLLAERIIQESCQAYGMRASILRYFNVAGADRCGETGELHEPETHLIPNMIRAALAPQNAALALFGDDYETADGTCIRDYVHVEDVCEGHVLALRHVSAHAGCFHFNLGSGIGYSIAEVLAVCRSLHRGRPAVRMEPRRAGDVARLVADASKAAAVLGWRPRYSLRDCVESASRWHRAQQRPDEPSASHPPGDTSLA